MHKARPFTVLCLLAALLLGACNSNKINYDLHTAIVGTWKGDQSGALLTIFGDGRFVLENARGVDAGTQIKGIIQRGRDQILFTYSSPAVLCPQNDGIYHFGRKGDVLSLTVASEECPERAAQIDATWTLANRIPTPLN